MINNVTFLVGGKKHVGCKKGKLTQSLKKPNLGRGCMNW